MDLILAEQTQLIALDDEKGRTKGEWGSDPGLAAALLLDLARRELAELDADGKIAAVDGERPAHELLAAAHAAIQSSSKRRSAEDWVARLPRELKPLPARVARGLVQRGILSEEHSKTLGILPTTRFPTIDPAPEQELRRRLEDVLLNGRDPSEDEALLLGLLEPLGLVDTLVPKDRRREARQRARAVAEQGIAGTAVREAVRSMQAAVIAAAIVPSVATTGH